MGSEWHEGVGPLVVPGMQSDSLCEGTVYGDPSMVRQGDGSSGIIHCYVVCNLCNLRVDADDRGVIVWPPLGCRYRTQPKPSKE